MLKDAGVAGLFALALRKFPFTLIAYGRPGEALLTLTVCGGGEAAPLCAVKDSESGVVSSEGPAGIRLGSPLTITPPPGCAKKGLPGGAATMTWRKLLPTAGMTRTRTPESATKMFPLASQASPTAEMRDAIVAGPPS